MQQIQVACTAWRFFQRPFKGGQKEANPLEKTNKTHLFYCQPALWPLSMLLTAQYAYFKKSRHNLQAGAMIVQWLSGCLNQPLTRVLFKTAYLSSLLLLSCAAGKHADKLNTANLLVPLVSVIAVQCKLNSGHNIQADGYILCKRPHFFFSNRGRHSLIRTD